MRRMQWYKSNENVEKMVRSRNGNRDTDQTEGEVKNLQRCWEDLAETVILLAVDDYLNAREKLRKQPKHKVARETLEECEEFFSSIWFAHLNNADGKKLLRRLREMELTAE